MIERPTSFAEALEVRAAHPDAMVIAGGTDVMVDVNFGRRHPSVAIDLMRVAELDDLEHEGDGVVRIGATVPYTRVIAELRDRAPGLAIAARTIGSPQIRNRGTIGGNLGSASPAGDAHPPLLACDAEIEAASVRGSRRIPAREFFLGPKRNALAADELIAAIRVPAARGPQQFAKVGPRNAMVIAVGSFALAIDRVRRRVGTGIGSAGPTPLRAPAAEGFLEGVLSERDAWEPNGPLDATTRREFGRLVAAAARPIDDVRGTARYRRHAIGVLASRTLGWAMEQRCA